MEPAFFSPISAQIRSLCRKATSMVPLSLPSLAHQSVPLPLPVPVPARRGCWPPPTARLVARPPDGGAAVLSPRSTHGTESGEGDGRGKEPHGRRGRGRGRESRLMRPKGKRRWGRTRQLNAAAFSCGSDHSNAARFHFWSIKCTSWKCLSANVQGGARVLMGIWGI